MFTHQTTNQPIFQNFQTPNMGIRMFLLSKLQPYGQRLCSTHKYMILCGGISQSDGLEVGKINYEDHSFLAVRRFVNATFDQQIRW